MDSETERLASAGEGEEYDKMFPALERLDEESSDDKTLVKEEEEETGDKDKLDDNMKALSLGDNNDGERVGDEASKLATLSKFLSVAVKGKEGQREILTVIK